MSETLKAELARAREEGAKWMLAKIEAREEEARNCVYCQHPDIHDSHNHVYTTDLEVRMFVGCRDRGEGPCCLAAGHPGYCVATLPIPRGHPLAGG